MPPEAVPSTIGGVMSKNLEATPEIRDHLGVMLGVTLALAVVLTVALGGGMEGASRGPWHGCWGARLIWCR